MKGIISNKDGAETRVLSAKVPLWLFEAVERFRQACSFLTRTEAIRALLVSGLEGSAQPASDERTGEGSEVFAPVNDEGARE